MRRNHMPGVRLNVRSIPATNRGPLARAPALLLVDYRLRRRRRRGTRMAIVSTTVSQG
jgi:hypothetical protein